MLFIAGILAVVILAILLAAPLTFFAMLFLGNIGVNLGFWALLPGAIALKIVATNISSTSTK